MPRYELCATPAARALLPYEAVIEHLDDDRAVVIATHAIAQGDCIVMRFSSPTGEATTAIARVLTCSSVTRGDALSWRLKLSISRVSGDWRVDPLSIA